MKRLFTVAVLATAIVPATAGAIPPDTQGGPLGSAACVVFSSPAPAANSCNFTGDANGLGYVGGSSTGGFSLTHVAKTVVCTAGTVTGFAAKVITDASGAGDGYTPFDFSGGPGYNFVVGRVYTFTVDGVGWGAVGGPSTPGASTPAEPATPSTANNFAGAEDQTGGLAIGSAC